MKLRSTILLLVVLFCCVLVASLSAQVGDPFNNPLVTGATNLQVHERTGGVLFVRVLDEKSKKLERQAVVKLYNEATGNGKMQITQDDAEAIFADLTPGKYRIEVSAIGYLTSTENVVIASSIANFHSEISLRVDSSAVELSAPGTGLTPKARKDISRAVAALNNGDWKKARKHLDSVNRVSPSNAEVSFLRGYMFFVQNDLASAKVHLAEAVGLDPANARALTLLGRVHLKQENYVEARKVLEEAAKLAGDSPVSRTALAEVYLRQHEYEESRAEAALAIEKSKGRATNAYLVHGTALANLRKPQEAIRQFKQYLRDYPGSPLTKQVNDLIGQLEQAAADPQQNTVVAVKAATALADSNLIADADSLASLKSWEPTEVDDAKPPVDESVVCPLDTVVANAGERMKTFQEDVARFEAIEEVEHQELSELGTALSNEKVKFDYVVDISEYKPGIFRVDEHRSGRAGITDFPGNIATRGLPALALVFHPGVNANYRVTCDGLGGWNGKPAWLLYFRQREDKPSTLHGYKIGEDVYSVDLKGRAWVDRDTYQIVHIEADMVKPMPQIQLLREHQVLDYAPVQFKSKNVELWLPKRAEIYFNFRRHRYMRWHSFDNFLLFAVDSADEHKAPPVPPGEKKAQP